MSPHPRYPHVFQPLRINRLEVKNRIFMPAHTTNFGAHHLPSERHATYHRMRARGGVAMNIFEAVRVSENTLGRPQGVAGFLPGAVDAFRRVAEAVHEEGGLLLGQVCHMGRQIEGDFERTVSSSASRLRWSPTAYLPRDMRRWEMEEIRDAHVRTSLNLLEAGLDGIELHWGHGHLLQQFLSPLSNVREDDYGGSTENRMRFPLEVLAALRRAVGAETCLGIRISAEEFVEGGLHLDEACAIVARLVPERLADFIHVSHSAYHMSHSLGTQMADMALDPAPFRALPGAIRSVVRKAGSEIPVFTVCKYRGLEEVEAMLAAGEADMVGMARAHVADPELVAKHRDGREGELRPCIGCNQGCAQRLELNIALTCMVNPMAGREAEWPEPEADRAAVPKKVLVVGGGPGGAEAAWVAAARGHDVTLWERGERLGGQLALAPEMALRDDFRLLLDYQARRLAATGVKVVVSKAADAAAIRDFGADAVVLATGSAPQPMVLADGTAALTMEAVLANPNLLGGRVAVYDTTGDWAALGFIEHLATAGGDAGLGREVTVFTPVAGFAWRTTIYSTTSTRKRLREKGVAIRTLRAVTGFAAPKLTLEDVSTGTTEVLDGFDTLVACQHNRPEDGLEAELRALGLAPVLAGDCLTPRTALEAVFEGHRAARGI
ncbi:FAD-dependent oxidoreductase [Marinibaculum pumilum]|uniref:FAD-dependent oxidoreductase n=1 Tax=Marinibaculum pumilum TaxID=1766165 RepID=A0ABV7L002_9PROT